MVGSILLIISVVSASSTFSLYGIACWRNTFRTYARALYLLTVSCITATAGVLLWYLLSHQFQYAYVYQYSARDLSFALLFSSLWAGQEGSFLLWALLAGWIGIVVLKQSATMNQESAVMVVYTAGLFFLTLLILLHSPFRYIWEVFDGVERGFVPFDGRGLNPLLQNFWMVLHPPFLFAGYALCMVPFSFTTAALVRTNSPELVRSLVPWVLSALLVLGTGIVFGGYWAYGVLGWGGWWGWDPVENASLIPWLFTIILFHALLVYHHTRHLGRTVFFSAWLAYTSVLLSAFLTRSGVLSDISVHSFLSAERGVYIVLASWLVLAFIGGTYLFFTKLRWIKSAVPQSPVFSRESMIMLGMLMTGSIVVIVLLGTLLPLFVSKLVQPEFYTKSILPLVVCGTVLLGLSIRLQWMEDGKRGLIRNLFVPLFIATSALCGTILIGLKEFEPGVLVFVSFFALSCAIIHGYRVARKEPNALGGAIAHSGFALFLLALVSSGMYGEKSTLSLEEGVPCKLYEKEFTFLGTRRTDAATVHFGVEVRSDGAVTVLEPSMAVSDGGASIYKRPDYWVRWNEDIYIEPISLESPLNDQYYSAIREARKHETVMIGNRMLRFIGFHIDREAMETMGEVSIGAHVEIRRGPRIDTISVVSLFDSRGLKKVIPTTIPADTVRIALLGVNVPMNNDAPSIRIGILRDMRVVPSASILVAEVSRKPFMSLLWCSMACLFLGIGVAGVRRIREQKQERRGTPTA